MTCPVGAIVDRTAADEPLVQLLNATQTSAHGDIFLPYLPVS